MPHLASMANVAMNQTSVGANRRQHYSDWIGKVSCRLSTIFYLLPASVNPQGLKLVSCFGLIQCFSVGFSLMRHRRGSPSWESSLVSTNFSLVSMIALPKLACWASELCGVRLKCPAFPKQSQHHQVRMDGVKPEFSTGNGAAHGSFLCWSWSSNARKICSTNRFSPPRASNSAFALFTRLNATPFACFHAFLASSNSVQRSLESVQVLGTRVSSKSLPVVWHRWSSAFFFRANTSAREAERIFPRRLRSRRLA